ncbi:MAG: complex I subunit 5 family protein [Candidatus Omnitrophota bacterium]
MSNFLSYPFFLADTLSGFTGLGIGVMFILILLYSFKFMSGKPDLARYYLCIILTVIAALGAVFSNNLIVLLVFWGFLGLLLYLLINNGDDPSRAAAKKALIVVGGTDALMILGIGIIYYYTQTFQMDLIRLEFSNVPLVLAYLCIASACFAKAGAMPFHSWIPDAAVSAPVAAVAYLPASLDKLLGIYLLTRLTLGLFVMNNALNITLMVIGAVTIIAAVMMALVQHNMKKLLGYHAVSQVGYMVLGIGTGNPIGIAGGIFHMLNHAVYKSCLFLTAGNVEHNTKTTELDELGGLAKSMPITWISCLIASLSISGIPPFNGFVSKWMIYQGLLGQLSAAGSAIRVVAVLCLAAAMFGSAFTLASFMKLLYAVFLGRSNASRKGLDNEVSWAMWLPCAILAVICIVFGVFAFVLPLKYFIFPAVSAYLPVQAGNLSGSWSPVLASSLILLGLLAGYIIFKSGHLKLKMRQDSFFTGCESVPQGQENTVTGTEFYNTVKEMGLLSRIYRMAERGSFDIYEQAKGIFSVSNLLRRLHNGVLPTYIVWMLLGMGGLFFVLMR